ncbi:MAG: cell wall-binding repeat-containing protein, partial [Microbacterium sp.]|nr:cell wall-binding repeat-containing protein [Microbacterium sp.]
FPDALSGAAAAGSRGGPVLLVEPGGIPEATAAELIRLAPKKIVALGGTGALTDAVLDDARSVLSYVSAQTP